MTARKIEWVRETKLEVDKAGAFVAVALVALCYCSYACNILISTFSKINHCSLCLSACLLR